MNRRVFQLRRTRNGIGADVVGYGGGHLGEGPKDAAQRIVDWCHEDQVTVVRVEIKRALCGGETELQSDELDQVRVRVKEVLPEGTVLEE